MKQQVNGQKTERSDRMLGVTMIVVGLVIAGFALHQTRPQPVEHAQATPQTSPSTNAPAESMPGGARPTTPAPEPARPQNNATDGATTGASPPASADRPPVTGTPLPPAPAEKAAPPIERK
jgi:hypothetical protein